MPKNTRGGGIYELFYGVQFGSECGIVHSYVPSPQTTAPTSAPRPGCDASSIRSRDMLSHSGFSIRTSRFASTSSVWNAPILTCSFSSTTRPVICRDAVGSTGEDGEDASPPAPDVGVTGGVNSIRVTLSVSVVRTRCDSEEPVADTVCTRLLGKSCWNVTSERGYRSKKSYRIAGARTLSP